MSKFNFNLTLGKKHRLSKKSDFSNLKENSRFLNNAYFRIYYTKSNSKESNYSRLAFSISSKVMNACKRNKVKRVLRETFRQSDFKFGGLDLNVVISTRMFNKISVKENFSEKIPPLVRNFYDSLEKLSVNDCIK